MSARSRCAAAALPERSTVCGALYVHNIRGRAYLEQGDGSRELILSTGIVIVLI